MAIGRELLCFENRAKNITVSITGGGATPATTSRGVTSVTKTATGTLKIQLDRIYKRILLAESWVEIDGAVTTTIADAANVDPRNAIVDGSVLVYTAASAGGANADIASTRDIFVELQLSDSDV